jgi:hypothetical protein
MPSQAAFALKIVRFKGAGEKNVAILPKDEGIANEISLRMGQTIKKCWKN